MAIQLECECGRRLKAPDGSEGKRFKCPACGAVLTVPVAEDSHTYDLAEHDAPPPAADRATATPAVPRVEDRLNSPLWQEATRRAAQRDQASSGPRPLFNVLGIEFTPVKLGVAAAVLAVLLGVPMWFFTLGPGVKAKVLSAATVHATPLLAGLDTQEPYNLFTGTGNRALGVKGPRLKNAPAAGVFATVDMVYSAGGSDELILTRPDPAGQHLLVEAQLAQGVFDAQGKATSDYKLHLVPDDFSLVPRGGGAALKPRLLFARFDDQVEIDIAGGQASGYQVLVPAGITPDREKLDTRHGGAAMGTVSFDSPQAKGEFAFESFYFMSGMPGVNGLSATGQLQRTTDGGVPVAYDYQGGSVEVAWPRGAHGWWSKPRYTTSLSFSSFSKVRVTLLFDRPAGDGPLDLMFVQQRVGSVRPGRAARAGDRLAQAQPLTPPADAPPAAAPGSGMNEPVTAYLQALADARKKAQGLVAMSNMNQIGIGIFLYAEQNQGHLPESLQQLRSVMPQMDAMLVNQRTGERPGFVYERPAERFSQIADPARTPLLWEARDGRKDEDGSVLYADGHVEARAKP